MRVRYLGETSPLELTQGKVYDVLSIERDWYRIVDDTGEDYLYPPEDFEVEEAEDGAIPLDGLPSHRQTQSDRADGTCEAWRP